MHGTQRQLQAVRPQQFGRAHRGAYHHGVEVFGDRLQRGRLRAASAREDGELQAAIRDAVSAEWDADGTPPPAKGLTVSREGHARGIGLVLQPIGADDGIAAVAG